MIYLVQVRGRNISEDYEHVQEPNSFLPLLALQRQEVTTWCSSREQPSVHGESLPCELCLLGYRDSSEGQSSLLVSYMAE